jgi:hypothetical protein
MILATRINPCPAGVLSPFLNLSFSLSLNADLALGNNAPGIHNAGFFISCCIAVTITADSIILTSNFTLLEPIDVEVVSSSIGPLDTKTLNQIVNDIVESIMLPWFNYMGQFKVQALPHHIFFLLFDTCSKGIALPVPKGLHLSNSSVTIGDFFVAISSDVSIE